MYFLYLVFAFFTISYKIKLKKKFNFENIENNISYKNNIGPTKEKILSTQNTLFKRMTKKSPIKIYKKYVKHEIINS